MNGKYIVKKQTQNVRILADGSTVLQHPLTCIVAGCTQSGKSVWVKTLFKMPKKL